MRFMVIMYPGPDVESRVPTEEDFAAMGAYNEELVKNGIMLGGEGLHPLSKGARVTWSGGKPIVSDGPFTEAKEVVGGYWLWQLKSKEEAIEWIRRCPGNDSQMIELRQIYETADFAQDFPDAFTPELAEAEERLRTQVDAQTAKGQD